MDIMDQLASAHTEVERVDVNRLSPANAKQVIARFRIRNLDPANPEIQLTAGEFGLRRVIYIHAVPINDMFFIYWNGEDGKTGTPALRFDEFTEGQTLEIVVNVWGY